VTALLVGAAVATALLLALPPPSRLSPQRGLPAAAGRATPALLSPLATTGSAVLLGGAVAVVLGGPAGVLGAVAAVGVSMLVLHRLAQLAARPRPLDAGDAALAGDLLAACVEAGLPITVALDQVAAAMPGPMGDALGRVGQMMAVGAEPATALAPLVAQPSTARLARGLVRALTSGVAPGPVLGAAAAGQRDRLRSARVARARGIGSRAALPVGLCFLPAFVLVAVVPVVVGGLSQAVAGP
jgi:Flp pilus assembly protein TadB